MRGVHSVVDEIRRNVFTEVARLAYEGGDLNRVDMIPYKLVPGEIAHYRHDVFLERAVVAARVRLALGMDLAPGKPRSALSDQIQEAATDQKYFEEPLEREKLRAMFSTLTVWLLQIRPRHPLSCIIIRTERQ